MAIRIKSFKNYIDGKWISKGSLGYFENINPADNRECVGRFPKSGKAEVNQAVSAAKRAFPVWSRIPAPKRAEMVMEAGNLLKKHKETIAQIQTREMGKILDETRGDVQEGIDCAYLASGEGRRLYGETTPSEMKDKFCMAVRMPIGVCGIITPWNFPMAIPTWKIFPALVCGNTIVFKPASDTPATAVKLVEILESAGIPKGVVNLVHGTGRDVGESLVEHKDVQLISFTGSSSVGKRIGEKCGKELKRLSLELGGKNAQIVMPDADMELALQGVLWGAFGTTGQRCTATSRLILHEEIYDKFLKLLVKEVKNITIGNGLNKNVKMGPCINEEQRKVVEEYVAIGKKECARLLCGGRQYIKGNAKYGTFYEPTIFSEVTPQMRIAKEEIFGPVLSVLRFKTYEDAIAIHNGTEYGLSSSIYTKDVNISFSAMRDLEAGITYINGPTIGAEVHLPFGGVKNTGNGHREAGKTVLDIFTEWKSVYVDFSGKLQKAQIDNR
ncbi:aldehyde dehydrogenase family protein [bacterium]|nr:aldehyde dehydrogenase family protein [bacterium]